MRHSRAALTYKRAQGTPGADTHPRSCVQWVEKSARKWSQVRRTTGIPCAMVYGLWRALPGVPGSLAPGVRKIIFRELDLSVGRPGPHAFAVRVRAARLAARPRPPHPTPHVS